MARAAALREAYAPVDRFDLDRSNAISDGIFAIALTLLVLGIDVPGGKQGHLWAALEDTLPQVVGYVISFWTVAALWLHHHRLFDDLEAVDNRLMQLNLAYLGFVAFLPFPSGLLGDYGDEAGSVVLFAVTVACTVGLGALLRLHARNAGLFKAQARHPQSDPSGALVPLVFLASVPLAFISPTVALYSWLVLPLLGRVWSRVAR
jgi:uncharacterized membrane protein